MLDIDWWKGFIIGTLLVGALLGIGLEHGCGYILHHLAWMP